MKDSAIFQYESEMNASYLVAILSDGSQPIQYQVGMLENNSISHLLDFKSYRQDGVAHFRYNVTSKLTLAQILGNQKISKNDFLQLLLGIVECSKDLPEYQLSANGLVLDAEHIFVRPGSFSPYLVYLPIYAEAGSIDVIRNFVRSFIMSSRIESSADNFVQRLLDIINDERLTLDGLHKQLSALRQPTSASRSSAQPVSGYSGALGFYNQSASASPVNGGMSSLPYQPAMQNNPAVSYPSPNSSAPTPQKSSPAQEQQAMPKKAEKKPKKQGQAKEKTKPDGKKGTSRESLIFTCVNAALILIAAFLAKNGLFLREDGSLNISYIFGILILIAGVDVIVYRELYVNNKSGSGTATKDSVKQNKTKKKGAKPLPGKAAESDAHVPPVYLPKREEQLPKQGSSPVSEPQNPPAYPVSHPPLQQPSVIPYPQSQPGYINMSNQQWMPTGNQMMQEEEAHTVVDDGQPFGNPYLEYYENGLAMHIHLNEGTVRVGSRPQSVNHVLRSDRVSKIHAEFVRDGQRYFVRDMNSTNGTYINGSKDRLVSNQLFEIHPGDHIRLANVELILKC